MSRTWKDHKDYWKTQPDCNHFTRHNIPSTYKAMNWKKRRAIESQAVRKNQEVPLFKKENTYYW